MTETRDLSSKRLDLKIRFSGASAATARYVRFYIQREAQLSASSFIHPVPARARNAELPGLFTLGFDIAPGSFGDPAQGALGNTLDGPGAQKILLA